MGGSVQQRAKALPGRGAWLQVSVGHADRRREGVDPEVSDVRLTVRALMLIAATCGLTACSFVHGSHQKVRISTNVPARIYVGDHLVAETSGGAATAKLRRGRNYVMTARADGYEESSTSLTREINLLGTLDLIGAILITVPVVTFATGHAYSLAPAEVHLDLERAGN
jgi:hypothetical protein